MLLVGHRGYSKKYPENTILSFRKAIEAGCDGVELDVRLSKDNKVVVFHDDILDRTTNGRGPIKNYTISELKSYDAGMGERIPMLEEVLDIVDGKLLLLEIKITKDEKQDSIERICLESLNIAGQRGNTYFISFNALALNILRRENKVCNLGYLFSKPITDETDLFSKINALCPRFDIMNKDIFKMADKYKFETFAWTVDTEADFRKINRYGLTGVVSNDPTTIKELV